MLLPEHIHLAKDWHPTKNGILTVNDVSSFSHKKVWWLCDKGHEWEAPISARSNGGKCPYCSGKRVLEGFNDLATTNISVAKQWHPIKNLPLYSSKVTQGSNKKVWWLCDKGHEWEAIIASRTLSKRGCPYCSGRKSIGDKTDLATINPDLAQQWHPTKNDNLTPKNVTAGSSKKVWWLGECGHEWEAIIYNRNKNGASCPYCSGHKKLVGFNDLQTTHPNLAAQWHPTKNGDLLPEHVSKGTDKKVWWLGDCGHEWKNNLSVRSRQNNSCPICLNRVIIPNYNDIASTSPSIAAQWHPTKNGDLLPEHVSKSSNKKVWWQCDKGHEWEAYIYSRERAGCRKCTAGEKNSKGEKELKDFIEQLGLHVEQANYGLIDKGEIDLFIPEKNIAIEFNGLWWHTESQGKDRNYHYDKWLQCKNKGIQLIHVWEDDWKNKKEIVKSSIKHKLGVYSGDKVYARKTKIVTMSKKNAQQFFTNNHIQGYASGSIYLGLEYKDVIEAAIIIKKENNGKTFNLIRYATHTLVVGGFTKLIAYLEKTYSFDEIVTFSDHVISDGSLYEKNGFIATKELKPDYMYYVNGERKHKFGYRLIKFKNDNNLLWDENLSESQLASLNNLERIWDAGKTKWVKNIK